MVTGLGVAAATSMELAGAGNLRTGENNVLSGFWLEGVIRVDTWENDHRG